MKKIGRIIIYIFFYLFNFQLNAQDIDSAEFIKEDYMIPSHNLYQQSWEQNHIRVGKLALPFGSSPDLKIILVENNSAFVLPCHPTKVISKYGMRGSRMHTGVDLKQNLNDSIVSCFDGVVRMAKTYGAYGNVVVVRHFNGLETVYAHLNAIKVKPNQKVMAGQLIGLAGRTGRATTEHLHFEVRFLCEHFDPAKMIDFETGQLFSNVLTLTREDLHTTEVYTNGMLEQDSANSLQQGTTTESVNTPIYHTIKQGDTLYKIANQYHVTVDSICELNHIKEETILQLGRKLRIK